MTKSDCSRAETNVLVFGYLANVLVFGYLANSPSGYLLDN